ncbi:MAG: CoB--CoM heterodisulfide reductase iron-sulfur subunit A family protein [Candidatus Thermoplasmatota archaeon]|nr:CoB--CoM heterodisulfide reductase iron-sulfur subunit A family protein [Candidatus Thermoplasmatota archaeon]MBU1941698.1 CoB--CoM heterodisulfide reductase iron-sulfur subunit A family protein [Candidatus Thermoplasmatota archaeon]
MPLKSYDKKIDHDLEIPLQDDYFYDEPEEIIENNNMPQLESTAKIVVERAKRGEKRAIQSDVLIIGAGISGMQAALDVADKGYKVVIIDKTSTIGGAMVKLDKTFPTNDCSICTAAPKMVELSRHPNINLITYAEVNSLEGKPGDFKVNIWRKSKYVDPDKCTGCDDCAEVCPVEVVNPFDEKLSTRKAIYIEFPQAVPIVYTIDYDACVGCGSCDRVCEPEAISFLEKSEEIEVNVGSVIVATGFEVFEPTEMRKEYGYSKYENVITALQFERLLSSFGPTEGKVFRLSDRKKPKSIGWIQCVGSRSEQLGFPYCSRVCCMYATKEASITKEANPEMDITIYYMDIRAYGKDFQQYYDHAKDLGVKYVRGRPSSVYENLDKSLTIRYKDTLTGKIEENKVDMLVLSTAIIPNQGNKKLGEILGINVDDNGFFKQSSLLTDPIQSSRDGIFLAGCIQGPKDIPDSVSMASGAAAKAIAPIKDREKHTGKEFPPEKDVLHEKPRIGVFICHCGKNISNYLDVDKVTEETKKLPNVDYAEHMMFACSEDSCKKIKESVQVKGLNRIIVAACSPRTHGGLFQDTLMEAGLNKYLFEMANIRNHCSWVHSNNWAEATDKAIRLVRASVAKARHLESLSEEEFSIYPRTLILGGGISGMKAALALANMGIKSIIIEKEPELGGRLRNLHSMFPTDTKTEDILKPMINEATRNKLITVMTNAELDELEGYIGNYKGKIKQKGKKKDIEFGTIIVATGFREINLKGKYQYGKNKNIISQTELETQLKKNTLRAPKNVVIINCAGAMDEERPYCCRVGCGVSIKNAKLISQKYPKTKTYLLYRDMRVFGKDEEEYYADVLKNSHLTTIRYPGDKKPEIILDKNNPIDGSVTVKVYDDILHEELEFPADLVVLTVNTEGEVMTNKLKNMLKVPVDAAGFFIETHAKIKPLDFSTSGVYMCGAAHYPKNLVDSIAQAEGAASRASIPIFQERMKGEGIVSEVNNEICRGCGICISACAYSAIDLQPHPRDSSRLVAEVNKALCKGCGSCAAACLNSAIEQKGYKNKQINEMIAALLEEKVAI